MNHAHPPLGKNTLGGVCTHLAEEHHHVAEQHNARARLATCDRLHLWTEPKWRLHLMPYAKQGGKRKVGSESGVAFGCARARTQHSSTQARLTHTQPLAMRRQGRVRVSTCYWS